MPAVSKKQYKLFSALAHGYKVPGVKVSKSKAKEWVAGVNYQNLPASKKKGKKRVGRKN